MQSETRSWIRVEDSLPSSGKRVLVRLADGRERFANVEVYGDGSHHSFFLAGTQVTIAVTHWQPIESPGNRGHAGLLLS